MAKLRRLQNDAPQNLSLKIMMALTFFLHNRSVHELVFDLVLIILLSLESLQYFTSINDIVKMNPLCKGQATPYINLSSMYSLRY